MRKLLTGLLLLAVLLAAHSARAGSSAVKRPIQVAVVDTGIDPALNHLLCPGLSRDFTGTGLIDSHENKHGSNISGIIAKYAGDANFCIIMLKALAPLSGNMPYYKALSYLKTLRPDFINLSIAGYRYVEREATVLKHHLNAGVVIVAAAGNDARFIGASQCNINPACVDSRIVVVGNSTSNSTNIGSFIDVYEDGTQRAAGVTATGTSQATAVHTGKLVKMRAEKRAKNEL